MKVAIYADEKDRAEEFAEAIEAYVIAVLPQDVGATVSIEPLTDMGKNEVKP